MLKRLLFSFASYLAAGLSPAWAQADGAAFAPLEPSSHWHLDYGDDSCRLSRTFGEGESKMAFYIERYEPGDAFFMVVAGKPLGRREHRSTDFAFGPGGATREDEQTNGDLGDFGPAVMVNSATLLPLADVRSDAGRKYDPAAAAYTDVFGQRLTPAQEAGITWLAIDPRGGKEVRLMLGPMDKPLAEMRKCTDELLTHWGLDLGELRGMTRAPAPLSNPGRWLVPGDYPSNALFRGQEGLVQFRLIVGIDGKPESCHIQRSTRPAEFDRAVCRGLMKRAKFDPALGADGKPIKSYWRNTVRFVTG